ncbi:MAG: hypothetical protein JO222_02300 [Frankiales bacterium]|nr:hypothetical protein [Frankiales bacterium]
MTEEAAPKQSPLSMTRQLGHRPNAVALSSRLMSESPALHDFDFLQGSWSVHNRRLLERLNGSDEWEEFETAVDSVPLLDGRGNIDTYRGVDIPMTAIALRLLDQATDQWWIYWSNGTSGQLDSPVCGRFVDEVGEFYGDDHHNEVPVRVRFVWQRVDDDHAEWTQAFSPDGGTTWETNWRMSFVRRSAMSR